MPAELAAPIAVDAESGGVPEKASSPPRAWVIIADWCNLLAGVVLMCAFLEGALINSVGMKSLLLAPGLPTTAAINWLQFFFSTEGVLYAVAEFFMVGIMAVTPAEFGGGSRGAMQFAILMAGGIFFAFSGLVFPGCISNVTYVFRKTACHHPAAEETPYAWNAMAHFGITCFMVGTSIGFLGVLKAPKNKIISPFWGCAMYFAGAWTIGIFKFWLPVLLGGFDSMQNENAVGKFKFDMSAPSVDWTWNWWAALLGAYFLTFGAFIFAVMNKSIKCR